MTYNELKEAWDAVAADRNKWDDISAYEQLEFAQRVQREACAKIADERALRCLEQVRRHNGRDEADINHLRSLAWQFSVLAGEMRKGE